MPVFGRAPAGVAAGLLERGNELGILESLLSEASDSSSGRVVLVSGEAGVGKSALLGRFCDGLGTRPPSARVLWAACDPLFTPRPLGPLLDISRFTDGRLRGLVDAGAKPHDVAVALLAELEFPAPTVFVLEDAHWADEATVDVLRLLSRRIDTTPALLIISYRDDELGRLHPLRGVLGPLPGSAALTRLRLGRLSADAVAELAAGSPVDADELYRTTSGNPFFVTEVLEAGTDQVPDTVRDAVLARTARLSRSARELLDAAAVVPQKAEMWLLESLIDAPAGVLEECLDSGMLRPRGMAVSFRHELARLAVEQALPPDWRRTLHSRALEALIDPPSGAPDLARVAHHAELALDRDAVLRFAPAAAERAASVGAHREAEGQYARALRFAGGLEPEARADLLERFSDECFLTDMRDEALEALDQALVIRAGRPGRAQAG